MELTGSMSHLAMDISADATNPPIYAIEPEGSRTMERSFAERHPDPSQHGVHRIKNKVGRACRCLFGATARVVRIGDVIFRILFSIYQINGGLQDKFYLYDISFNTSENCHLQTLWIVNTCVVTC